jgi:hypothetical protein
MTASMVPGYRHLPGNHCGSTAVRNLLAFHGTTISEEMALGLGAGVCFYYVVVDGESPSRFANGRVARLEEQFVELTGLPLRLETFDGADDAWEAARSVVESGRPALLLTDLYYLDHYGTSAHFPGHAVVLVGYDDEVAYLSDTAFSELQTTRLENLARARHGDLPIFPLSGHMLSAPNGVALGDPRSAAPRAIERNARQMLEPALGEYQGLPALRRFAADVGGWPDQAPDWQWCARFCYQVIERRGTGGGNFRRMYSRFLVEVAESGLAPVSAEADLAATAADGWTTLAEAMLAASEDDEPEPAQWRRIEEEAAKVLAVEERLWPRLADIASR